MTTKIGELVRLNLPQLFDFCAEHDPEEVARLADKDYSRETFGLSSYAFLAMPAEATWIKQSTGYSHYWAQVYVILGHEIRVCQEWIEKRHRARFLTYLLSLGLMPVGVDQDELASAVAASQGEEESGEVASEPSGGASAPLGSLGVRATRSTRPATRRTRPCASSSAASPRSPSPRPTGSRWSVPSASAAPTAASVGRW